MRDDDLRLADLLAALSVTTDLGMGQEPEKAVRGCLVATGLARAMDLPEAEVRDVFWTTLLQHVGCTAPAHETSYLFGDDLTVAVQAERTDSASLRETLALLATVGRGTGVDRPRHLARMIAAGKDGSRGIARAVCEVGDLMAERLALGAGVRLGLRHSMERWDGKGDAYRLAGDDIALPARVSVVATQAVIFDRLGGPDAAVQMARRRAGGWFDPAVADRFARVGAGVLGRLAAAGVWAEVLEAEPGRSAGSPGSGSTTWPGPSPTWSTCSPRSPSATRPAWPNSPGRPPGCWGSQTATPTCSAGRPCCTTWGGWRSRAASGRGPGR